MEIKLTPEEYKDLVVKIAIKISPILVKIKPDSLSAGEHIALYAKDIADAVEVVLKKGI
ncbi:hypothetical protein V8G69_16170 [Gaetbulibacter sp. M235]|uniref:hypothetical protein n=1 Tax=Gaetbulibacter sp. M235 TaxID=3126510 RepID=UPI00374F3B5E